MPSQPREGRQHRSVTFFDVPWEVGREATEAVGTTRNEVLEALLDWYLRAPGAELPERPPADLLERLFAKWRAREEGIRELALTLSCPTCKAVRGPCLAGKAKKPTADLIHRPRLLAATAMYDAQHRPAS